MSNLQKHNQSLQLVRHSVDLSGVQLSRREQRMLESAKEVEANQIKKTLFIENQKAEIQAKNDLMREKELQKKKKVEAYIKMALQRKNKEEKQRAAQKLFEQSQKAKQEKKLAEQYFREQQIKEQEEKEKERRMVIEQHKLALQKEQQRSIKLQNAIEFQREQIIQKEEKLKDLLTQNEMKAQLLIKQQARKRKIMAIKTQKQYERAINARENLRMEEEKKNQQIIAKRKLDYLREEKIKSLKQILQRNLSEKGQLQKSKIQEAIELSETHSNQRKSMLLNKQMLSEKRIENQKELLAKQQKNKKQIRETLLEIKKKNLERKKRKDDYMSLQTMSKIYNTEQRLNEFIEHKNKVKQLKLINQTEGMNKRETMRKAFYHMAVWKVYDLNLISSLLERNVMSPTNTIETIVRNRAAKMRKMSIISIGSYRQHNQMRPTTHALSLNGNEATNEGTPPYSEDEFADCTPTSQKDNKNNDCS